MHTPFKPLFVIAALLATACADAGPLGVPVSLPLPVGPTVDGIAASTMPYIGDVENIRPIRGPGNVTPSGGPLPGLEGLPTTPSAHSTSAKSKH